MPHFWTGGPAAHHTAIQQEHDDRLRELQEKLRNATTDEEKLKIKQSTREERAAHQDRLAQINRSLY